MPKLSPNARKGVTVALVLALVAFVHPNEGRRLVAYRDIVGVPTICDGITEDVHIGDVKTDVECDAMDFGTAESSMNVVFDAIPNAAAQPDDRLVALGDLEYNVGGGSFRRSRTVQFMNAGNYRAACDAILGFVYVKDGYDEAKKHWRYKVSKGLVLRRQRERTLCLKGL